MHERSVYPSISDCNRVLIVLQTLKLDEQDFLGEASCSLSEVIISKELSIFDWEVTKCILDGMHTEASFPKSLVLLSPHLFCVFIYKPEFSFVTSVMPHNVLS